MAMMAPAIAIDTAVPVVVTIVRGRLVLVGRLRLGIASRLCVGLGCCRRLGWRCHGKCTCKEQKT